MPDTVTDADIKAAYAGPFREALEGRWKQWRARYLQYVESLDNIGGDGWLTPKVQQTLWESNAITTIGPGSSVTVSGAYADQAIAQKIKAMRESKLPDSAEERGLALLQYYDALLASIEQYNDRKPRARLRRLLAGLFPHDVTCIVDRLRLWKVLRLVGITPSKGAGPIAQHPVLLERLRRVLGQAPSREIQVDQSLFCWFLWEHFCSQSEDGSLTVKPQTATDLPSLSLLPVSVQRKGLSYVQQNVPLLVAVVREAEQGITRPDLIAVILREAPHLKAAGSAAITISQAQGGLTLIGLSDGAYRPTEQGLELLSAPDPRQVLQPLLIGRVFGVGQMLLTLQGETEGKNQKELAQYLAALSPTRKSTWAGNELIQWGLATDLVWRKGAKVGLTEDGAAYAAALPGDFLSKWRVDPPSDPIEDTPEVSPSEEGIEASSDVLKHVQLEELQKSFTDGEISSQLVISPGLLGELHAALHSTKHKRFVLLAGLSGTGKTSITRAYAEAYCRALGMADWRKHYLQVAVRPDWTDPTGLLGFVNTITDPPSYRTADTLNLLIEADKDRTRPYFLCLDEMNLARVEHYFAPFLSAMEGARSRLAIHGEIEAVDNVDPAIDWPQNLFIFGTVNMDESTHPFSDKVLDRAFTFEFWDVDLNKWEQKRRAEPDGAASAIIDHVVPILREFYGALFPARRHFGYRTADEVLNFCCANGGLLPSEELLDAAIFMKILPRVRGDDSGQLKGALEALAKIAGPLPRTLQKIRQMQESLAITGQARFWS